VPLSVLAGLEPVVPAGPVRFPLHASITQETRNKLAYPRDLLGHAVPGGDTAEVLDRALDALIAALEKRRFGKGARSRPARRTGCTNERYIPMPVRAGVFRRDGGACSFVGETGHRCGSRQRLQFDHIVPLAKGGLSTASNLRLRCQTHNQLEAERAFGREFMQGKRERAKQRQPQQRSAPPAAPTPAWRDDVFAALCSLGFKQNEAQGALLRCDLGPDATLEQRVRTALQHLAPPTRREAPAA
jgi:5-methylcytosine-specific restriction endonuclease McrA